jgi:iron(II)-dependent oxidoreductase
MLAAPALAALVGGIAAAGEPIPGNPLIAIAAGPFVFGTDAGNEDTRPRRVLDGRAFAINRTEISNAEYRRFVEAAGHRPAFYGAHPLLGRDDHPVVGVSWHDAAAFCAHHGLALPTEQQYERAARGVQGASFPWGEAPADATHANGGSEVCCGGSEHDGYMMTAPVEAFAAGATPEGILNLVGNVWEWTRDAYAPYEGDAASDIAGRYRVLRGGAWNSDAKRLSATYRLAYDADFRFAANGGFRCTRSLD